MHVYLLHWLLYSSFGPSPPLIFWFPNLFWHMVGLLGWVISLSQGLYLHRTTQHRKTRTNIHALSGIWTCSPVYERSRPAPQTAWPLDQHVYQHRTYWHLCHFMCQSLPQIEMLFCNSLVRVLQSCCGQRVFHFSCNWGTHSGYKMHWTKRLLTVHWLDKLWTKKFGCKIRRPKTDWTNTWLDKTKSGHNIWEPCWEMDLIWTSLQWLQSDIFIKKPSWNPEEICSFLLKFSHYPARLSY
jgi:hypothetical protein